ncbi:outer membrane protein assembly factor BamA [Coralloluteibacterium stylophorae]|uniref:Outer membrane protein assembly factor BamA n=1 Tax=Coralloluteibacterium stylophorae TaxID=1776034 RepID=A0AAP2FZ16_9GAMM|nr:outer membrane protein assembly factor BamA [Coralloluteibacterium stylophorae]MBS7456345.1 outer membrane protein assembly factor BamA [Coralloluteibacterium stylophorae]
MKRTVNRRLLALALAAAVCAPVAAQNVAPFTVSDIRVDGLQRISAGTVFTYLPVERGDTLDATRSADAIRALFSTGFFEDITLSREGDILVVNVRERPAINQITLSGNKDIQTEDLQRGLRDIGLAEGETFNRLSLERVTQELTRQYNNRGKYSVTITPDVKQLDRNRVDVNIVIVEGKAAKIRHINLVGNETYEDETIRESWESNTSNWLSWYRRDDQYSQEKLSGDLEKLDSWYLDRGYVDFNIDSTQVSISPDKQDMSLVANVSEGEVYTISDVKVTGDTILPQEQIEQMVIVRPEQIFSRRLLEATSERITTVLANIGYAFAEVNPIPEIDRENRTVALNFNVQPGPRVYVRRIEFKGNARTSDEVLRREMRQFEGSWYSQAAIDRSKIRLQRLGFFESGGVEVQTPRVEGSPDQVDVVVTVKETTSGSFVFGLGYSQLSGLITQVQLSQNNFLGSGNQFSIAAQRNDYLQRYDFTYLDPYFTDDGMSLGYNLYWREFDQSNYNIAQFSSTARGARALFGLPITETDTVSANFGIESNEIFAYPGYTPQEIVDYIDAVGNRTFKTWSLELAWARDTRNDFFQPTRGTYQRVGAQIALPGSTVEYYKLNYQYSKYWPLTSWLVMRTGLDLGYGDSYGDDFTRTVTGPRADCPDEEESCTVTLTASGLPFFENFYAGGVNSVRGFRDNTLGPYAYATGSSYRQPLGGAIKTVGQLEFFFPRLLDTPAARVSAFVDVGNVYSDTDDFDTGDLRASAGIALQWRAPIGPISISYAYPVKKEDDDELERLQFTFGSTF